MFSVERKKRPVPHRNEGRSRGKKSVSHEEIRSVFSQGEKRLTKNFSYRQLPGGRFEEAEENDRCNCERKFYKSLVKGGTGEGDSAQS